MLSESTDHTRPDLRSTYCESVDVLIARWLDVVDLMVRARDLRGRAVDKTAFLEELEKIDEMLAALSSTITQSAADLQELSKLETSNCELIVERSFEFSHSHGWWIDYAESRLESARILLESLT